MVVREKWFLFEALFRVRRVVFFVGASFFLMPRQMYRYGCRITVDGEGRGMGVGIMHMAGGLTERRDMNRKKWEFLSRTKERKKGGKTMVETQSGKG